MRIDVRGYNIDLQPALGAYAERRILTALKRFGHRVMRVTVRLIDTNGPKKGIDKKVQVAVDIARTRPMLVEELHPDPYTAIDAVADRVARVVAEVLARKRSGRAPRASGVSPFVTGASGALLHSWNDPS
jgi:ribosomal subunit interface protein